MVETTLAIGFVTALVLALLQLGLVLHARNVLVAAAADGARYAAAADRSPGDGAARAEAVARTALPALHPAAAGGITAVGGRAAVEVVVRARLPVLGPFGLPGHLAVRAHALAEGRR